jgi:hypothetical protein
MKSVFLVCFLLTAKLCSSQDFLLSIGGNMASSTNTSVKFFQDSYYEGKIKGGFQWTASAEFVFPSKFSIEIANYHQSTSGDIDGNYIDENAQPFDVDINWLMFKGNKYFSIKPEKVQLFAGAGAGLATFKSFLPVVVKRGTDDSFAWQLHGGILFWPTKTIGLKANIQYQMAPQGTGLAFTWDFPRSTKVNEATSFNQLSGGLSLVINMNNLSEKN